MSLHEFVIDWTVLSMGIREHLCRAVLEREVPMMVCLNPLPCEDHGHQMATDPTEDPNR